MQFCKTYKDIPEYIKSRLCDANVFYTPEYENNVLLRHQTIIYLWDEREILVARMKKVLFLKAAVLDSEPYIYGEGVNTKAFLDEAMQVLKDNGVQWTVCSTTAMFNNYPQKSRVVPSGDYVIDLSLSEEELWGNVHSKHRNSIRKGEKDGIVIQFGSNDEQIKDYSELSKETYERSNLDGSDVNYYKSLIEGLEKYTVLAFAKDAKDVLQSAGMFYYNKNIAYYLHGASVRKPSPGATNYLLWTTIMHFKQMGVRRFSFVGYHNNAEPGSKLDGIQRFKERFGGPLVPSYNFKYIQYKFAYKLFSIAMQLKSRNIFKTYKDSIDEQIEEFGYEDLNNN